MKKLYVIMLVAIPLLLFNRETTFAEQKNFEKVCNSDDINYSQKMGYSSKEAFNFGKKILSVLKNKSIEDLYGLIDGELLYGPRKSFALKVGFEKIFSDGWLEDVLAEKPPCSPVGWRGFMIANGSIWFDKTVNGRWRIRSILGVQEEELIEYPEGWKLVDGTIHPNCFSYNWMSSDNFEEFSTYFKIDDLNNLIANPGIYFGKEINNFYPIKPSWCDSEDCEQISLVNYTKECSETGNLKTEIDVKGSKFAYRLLKLVDKKLCSKLTPNLNLPCESSYLIWVGENHGGSMGWHSAIGIFGLFKDDQGEHMVVPLKFFSSKNVGLNFIEGS